MAWLLTALCIAALGVLLYFEARRPRHRIYPKLVASTAFIGVAIAAGGFDTTFGTIIIIGLALSWFGDLFLALDGRRPFVAGLVAFLAGHIAYVVAFTERGLEDAFPFPVISVAILGAAIGSWLMPTVPRELKGPVIAYIVVISLMVAFAFATHTFAADWRLPAGAAAFYLSDIGVARDRFAAPGFSNRIVGLPLYYGGQLLLAWAAGG